ncbi:interferon-induced GTP-binding protein Mx-like isoform X2 [Boleophthalmus pectinirostris]|nr:interferon-induced GTP-binding protein Mx-like isoform X2 [Boleophthalmus pectinirostris]
MHSGMFILEIFSPDVQDLTLIALPSIPTDEGYEQTKNKIKTHIMEFTTNPECIILMVVPCNVDITTTEAFKLAQEVDPDGERTLGILTKPDLVDQDKEKDIVAIVQNKFIKLKKGFMIVRCYDQTKNSVMDPIEKEQTFFKDHALFKSFYDDGFATFPKLSERLCKELMQQTEKNLPQLKEYVKKELLEANAALKRLGDAPPSDEADKLTFLTNKLTKFIQDVMRLTTGDLMDLTDQNVFDVWRKIVKDSDESFQCKLEVELAHQQSEVSNFETLEHLIKHQIKLLEDPALFTLNNMTEIVRNELLKLMENHFLGFNNLICKVKSTISDVTSKKQMAAESWLRTHLRMEQFEVQAEASRCKQKTEKKRGTATQLYSYYQTVCQRLACHIPMMIRFYMFKELSTELQTKLLQILNDTKVSNLLNYNLVGLRRETERSFIPLTKAQIMLLKL